MSLEGVPAPTCPWLIVQGDHDELVNYHGGDRVGVEAARIRLRSSLLPGVEHFFHGKLNELRDAITAVRRKS